MSSLADVAVKKPPRPSLYSAYLAEKAEKAEKAENAEKAEKAGKKESMTIDDVNHLNCKVIVFSDGYIFINE